MKLLAISTSSKAASAALYFDSVLIASIINDEGLTHSQTIMPMVDKLLEDNNINIKEIDCIAVDAGPGSFTGVRIGVCNANAISYALSIPVIAISSLDALCQSVKHHASVCALIDARNSNGYAAHYLNGECVIEPLAISVSEFVPTLPSSTYFIGDGACAYKDEIKEILADASFADESESLLSAIHIGAAAFKKAEKGEFEKEVYPLYLRPSQAERLFKEKNG